MKKKYLTKIPADGKPDIIQMHNILQSILYHLESTLRKRYNTEGFGHYLVTKNEDGSKKYENWIQVLFIVQMKMETVPVKWK